MIPGNEEAWPEHRDGLLEFTCERVDGMRIGAHISSAGNFVRAAENAVHLGLNCVQYFTRNPRGGNQRSLGESEVQGWHSLLQKVDLDPVVMHAPYTVNLASPRGHVVKFGRKTVAEDLMRCRLLGTEYLVLHPGNHAGGGRRSGIELIIAGLNRAMDEAREALDDGVLLLLELMSGQGSELGSTLEEMAEMLDGLDDPDSVGICFDTCHCHARGYRLSSCGDLDDFLRKFDELVGLDRLKIVHLNDSMHERGSRKDRHALLGEGTLGKEGIKTIINHPELRDRPFILEVPVDKEQQYAKQADVARRWRE